MEAWPLTALLLFPLLLTSSSRAQTSPTSYSLCQFTFAGNYTANSTFESNLKTLLSNLSSTTPKTSGFFTSTSGSVPNRVHGLALCRGDASPSACGSCLGYAASVLPEQCPYQKATVVWYDLCLIHYSDTGFFGFKDHGYTRSSGNATKFSSADASRSNELITSMLDSLRQYAVANATSPTLFAAGRMPVGGLGGYDTLYGLVQCTRDISADDCDLCLKAIFEDLESCCSGPAIGGRVLAATCIFRYEVWPFYNWSRELLLSPITVAGPVAPPVASLKPSSPPTAAQTGEKKNSTRIIIATVIPILILVVLVAAIRFFYFRRRKLTKSKSYGRLQEVDGSLLFNLDAISRATDNFSPSYKLGEGGFGQVYKGVLPDGQEIAVKRITAGSPQGLHQLKNEIVLLAKLQHRNLVRILGVCFDGDEKMLIYEYVPNKSLDAILFDPIRKHQLSWETRYTIVMGIARGLQYLHEESQVKIIHRDLKAGNILLDAELNPKISDFGAARLFELDQTRACTKTIVGTFGYMPPEYVMRGRFSNKTDVFSYGVLVLEIITGCRNADFRSDEENSRDLLSFVWERWLSGSVSEIVDNSLDGDYQKNEVQRCIHIALLCVQELPIDRPTMSTVVLMLNSHTISTLAPKRPAFLTNRSKMGEPIAKLEAASNADLSVTELEPR